MSSDNGPGPSAFALTFIVLAAALFGLGFAVGRFALLTAP